MLSDAKVLPDFKEANSELPGILPNPYLAALFGALKQVPRVSACSRTFVAA